MSLCNASKCGLHRAEEGTDFALNLMYSLRWTLTFLLTASICGLLTGMSVMPGIKVLLTPEPPETVRSGGNGAQVIIAGLCTQDIALWCPFMKTKSQVAVCGLHTDSRGPMTAPRIKEADIIVSSMTRSTTTGRRLADFEPFWYNIWESYPLTVCCRLQLSTMIKLLNVEFEPGV